MSFYFNQFSLTSFDIKQYSHNDKVSYVKKTIICFKSVSVYKKDKVIKN